MTKAEDSDQDAKKAVDESQELEKDKRKKALVKKRKKVKKDKINSGSAPKASNEDSSNG